MFNGTAYGSADYVFPAKDGSGNPTYVTHTLEPATPIEGSFSFTLGSKQCCLVITLFQKNATTRIALPAGTYQPANAPVYDLHGNKLSTPAKGINIIRSAEGRLQGKNGKKAITK